MQDSNPWGDPRTWTAVAGSIVGALGLLYGIISGYWNRRESRLDALSKILQPLTRAAQHLHKANRVRRSREQLLRSFPNQETAKDAAKRAEEFFAEYGESIKDAEKEFRLAESELAARSFRFPDRIHQLTRDAIDSLSEFGRLVNLGVSANGDAAFAKFNDDMKIISKVARGWRLADPFEGLKQRSRKKAPAKVESRFELSNEEMKSIIEMVGKRASSEARNTFAVHPPKKLLRDPSIATSDQVIEDLENEVFVVAFQDGTIKLMTLVELMFFTYQLISLEMQMREMGEMMKHAPPSDVRLSVKLKFCTDDLMRPEMVKMLLSKIHFSNVPSDEGA